MKRRDFFSKLLLLFVPSIFASRTIKAEGSAAQHIDITECRPKIDRGVVFASVGEFHKIYGCDAGRQCRDELMRAGLLVGKRHVLTPDKKGVIITNIYRSYQDYALAQVKFKNSRRVVPEAAMVTFRRLT